jgi:hypothetical protein
MDCTNKTSLQSLFAFTIISIIAMAFGYWFAQQQLLAVTPSASLTYPSTFFGLTIIKVYLTILIFWGCSLLYLSYLSRSAINNIYIAISYLPLLLIFIHGSLLTAICLVLTIQFFILLHAWRSQDYYGWSINSVQNISALGFLILLHFFLTTRFSPWHSSMSLLQDPAIEITAVATLYKSFILATQFSFTNFDYTAWAGILNPPITLASPLLQLTAVILALPSINVTPYFTSLHSIFLATIIAGSFGYYLLLKYTAKVSFLFALLGGFLFFFGGHPLGREMFNNDGGIFLSSYALYPFALLIINLAFEKKNYYLSSWAGVILAAQFFIFAPHPEGIMYLLLFYGIFCMGLCLFSTHLTWYHKICLVGLSFFVFALLSAYTIIPIMVDIMHSNLKVFSHIGDIQAATWSDTQRYRLLALVFLPYSFTLLLLQRRLSPFYLAIALLTLFLEILQYLCQYVTFVTWLTQTLHVGLHLWATWRLGLFFYATVTILILMALDATTKQAMFLLCKKYPILLKGPK